MKVREDRGFTLVELLIVVAIIGILAAIAIPQFGAYRRRGYNSAAISDMRNTRTTQEAMMADFQDYGASHSATSTYNNTAEIAGSSNNVGTLFLSTARTTTAVQQVSLSRGVTIIADPLEANSLNGTYLGKGVNATGDTVYGVDSDTTAIYRSNCTVAGTCGAADLLKVPADAASGDQFSGVAGWTQM
ncbi:MAG: prepilin-type N-terminal cleavage/methylation domain-containing protein [Nitrospirae bacterium]|nr:MAG: prepilin-type N-terminal cleavage/methylation domain-containing protein [Nitrospirota bacterium]